MCTPATEINAHPAVCCTVLQHTPCYAGSRNLSAAELLLAHCKQALQRPCNSTATDAEEAVTMQAVPRISTGCSYFRQQLRSCSSASAAIQHKLREALVGSEWIEESADQACRPHEQQALLSTLLLTWCFCRLSWRQNHTEEAQKR